MSPLRSPKSTEYPGGLTGPQWGLLGAVAATRLVGHVAPFGNPMLKALERRGYVELRGAPALSRKVRWFATLKGYDLIEQDRRDRGFVAPALRRCTPSRPDIWRGTPTPDSAFTAEQMLELQRRGLDPTRVRTIVVTRELSEREHPVTYGEERPTAKHRCPVVGLCRKGAWAGRVAIISPAGIFTAVERDGRVPTDKPVAAYGREAWL